MADAGRVRVALAIFCLSRRCANASGFFLLLFLLLPAHRAGPFELFAFIVHAK